jgi:hypothetical protein
MSQRTVNKTATRSAAPPSINPALQAALSNLDVQLEAELARYRRQQGRTPATNPSQQPPARSPVESIAISITDPPQPAIASNPLPSSAKEQLVLSPHPSADSSAQTPTGNLVNPHTSQPAVEDYLASSEQLRRSLSDEDANLPDESSLLDGVLSPLGIGSMLLLLLSSVSMGYLLMNPTALSRLGLDRFWRKPAATVAQSPIPSTSPVASVPAIAPLPNGPNLSQEEFVDLNLRNLSSLNINSSPSPLPSAQRVLAAPTAPPSGSATVKNNPGAPGLASALLPESLQPSAPPLVSGTSAQQQATPTASATIRPRSAKEYYSVLINYEGESSLTKAKTVARDAYLRSFPDGTKIQMGTFPKESQAQKFVEELKNKGFSAWIY